MMRIRVNPKGGICRRGGGGYIGNRLLQPLDTAKIYSVRFNVHIIRSDGTSYRPDFVKYFGITFSDKAIRIPNPDCMLANDSPFLIDTVILAQWHTVQYYLKPTRPLLHIVLGAFYNPAAPYSFPEDDQGISYYFFIDEIDIHAITEADSLAGQPTAYPHLNVKPFDKSVVALEADSERPRYAAHAIHFKTGSDSLSDAACKTLDTAVVYLQKNRDRILLLRGYTDRIGKQQDNVELSERRALSVRHYLMQKGKLPSFRFDVRAFGADSALADNDSERGRQLNRRVTISESAMKVPVRLYRLASKAALSGNRDSAFYYLKAWLSFDNADKILLLHDPELFVLHNLPAWKYIVSQVKDQYKSYPKPDKSFFLANMYIKDQYYRSAGNQYIKIKGYSPVPDESTDSKIAIAQDSLNLLAMLPLLDDYPWSSAQEVGELQARVYPYILLHCNNYTVMKKYLSMVERACKEKRMEWSYYATLWDRIQLHDAGTQYYGTQFRISPTDPSRYERAPIEPPEQVNERRALLGLPPIDLDFFITINKKNNK